ncbi:MAG: hypothetical protein ACE5IL_12240 [Myxococcota bacterium]
MRRAVSELSLPISISPTPDLRATPPLATSAGRRDRRRELTAVLAELGLAGRVRVGIPQPLASPRSPDTPTADPIPLSTSPTTDRGGDPPRGRPAPDPLLGPETAAPSPELESKRPGQLIEIAGALSSGRTALAYRLASHVTARGELVGWVDLPDALDPRFLRRSGTDLARTLWVRPPTRIAALRASEILLRTGFALVVLDLEGTRRAAPVVPPSVWIRLARRARSARATLVVLDSERMAGSFAALGLETERRRARFEGGLFEGLESQVWIARARSGSSLGSLSPLVQRDPSLVQQGRRGSPPTFAVHQRPT